MAKKKSKNVADFRARHYQSPNIPMAAIRRYSRQIAQRFRPDKIILFGSYAYGTPHQDSDVDLLVIMDAPNEITQAIRIRHAIPAPFAMDLVVRKPKRLDYRIRQGDWFLREITEKGKVLYEAIDSAVGSKSRGRLAQRTGPRKKQTAAQ